MSKYLNKKITIDGITFDSKKESARYLQLKALERAGEITELTLQPRFNYEQSNEFGNIKKPKNLFYYKADFQYYKKGDCFPTIEDVKGFQTAVFRLKKKLIEDRFKIEIHLV